MSNRISGLVIIVSFFLIYREAFLNVYAWSDDYPTFINPQDHALHALRDLRPLHSLLLLAWSPMESVSQLSIIRIISIVAVSISSLLTWKILNKVEPNTSNLWAPLIAFSTPATSSLVFFATSYGVLIAQAVALLGGIAISQRDRYAKVFGVFLLSASILIYPLSAVLPIALGLVMLLESPKAFLSNLQKLSGHGFSFVAAALVAFAVSYLALKFFSSEPENQRVGIVKLANLKETTLFFVTRTVPQGFRIFWFDRPSNLLVFVQILLVLCLIFVSFFLNQRSLKLSLMSSLLLICCVVCVLSPMFFFAYNQVEPRLFVSSTFLIILVIYRNYAKFFSTKHNLLLKKRNSTLRRTSSKTLYSSVILLSLLMTNQMFSQGVRPIIENTSVFLQESLDNCVTNNQVEDFIVEERTRDWPSRSYLGMFSQVSDLASGWVPEYALRIKVLEEIGLDPGSIDTVTRPNQSLLNSEGTCLVSLENFELLIGNNPDR